MYRTSLLLVVSLFASRSVLAQSCDGYPFTDGINIEESKGSIRIVSTSSAPLSSSDPAAVRTARSGTQASAQAALEQFLTKDIKDPALVLRAVETSPSMRGDAYARRVTAAETATLLAPSASSLTSEIAVLKLCSTKGEVLRLSVVVKPEAMKRAIAAAKGTPVQSPGSSASQQSAQQQAADNGTSWEDVDATEAWPEDKSAE